MSSHHDALNKDLLRGVKKVHIVGIGGISMSAIAKILVDRGFSCTGSDKVHNDNCADVEALGVRVFIGHEASNITDQDLVIYTAAVNESIPEIARAKELGIPVVGRAKFLGELMEEYDNSIAVSGAHGKTSTTSMIAHILRDVLDPTVLVGGLLSDNHSNVMIGDTSTFIHEACEFKDTFLSLRPKYSIILNVDADHLDYFSGLDAIEASFRTFALSTKNLVFYNADDSSSRRAVEGIPHKYAVRADEGRTESCRADSCRADSCRAAECCGEITPDTPGAHTTYEIESDRSCGGQASECRDDKCTSDKCTSDKCTGEIECRVSDVPESSQHGVGCESNGPLLVSFGQAEDADYRVVDLRRGPGATAQFKMEKDGKILAEIALSVPGFIYWSNAAAAFACCYENLLESIQSDGDSALRGGSAPCSASAPCVRSEQRTAVTPCSSTAPCTSTAPHTGSALCDCDENVTSADITLTASVSIAAFIAERLGDFANAGRRFEVYGTYGGITVVDDFAHHPNEIRPALETATAVSPGRVIALFQPYTYSRTKELLDDFGRCFVGIDELVVSDILGGREIDPGDIHARDVVRVAKENGVSAHLSDTLENAGDLAMSLAREGDMIITLGCGNVYLAARYMDRKFREETDEETGVQRPVGK